MDGWMDRWVDGWKVETDKRMKAIKQFEGDQKNFMHASSSIHNSPFIHSQFTIHSSIIHPQFINPTHPSIHSISLIPSLAASSQLFILDISFSWCFYNFHACNTFRLLFYSSISDCLYHPSIYLSLSVVYLPKSIFV